MPSLTDGAIRRAIKEVEVSQKPIALADGEGHGTGRLILVIRPMPTRVTADWMAQQWRDGGRSRKKFGAYPSMGLSRAREIGFVSPEHVPAFEGEEGWFEMERIRAKPWSYWRAIRRVDPPPHA